MNLYLVHASRSYTFCIGREDALNTFENYVGQYGSKAQVSYITTLTDVTGDFEE